jgi:ABC-type transport system involved in multi-copper enzyme maturation permease subunit
MLRSELAKQLLRTRTLVALFIAAVVPIAFGLATSGDAGGRNGTQSGFYGAAPFSALNHVAASLQFTAPLLLALVVALIGSALGAADRAWGTLRYLYVEPVSQRRLLTGKCLALAISSVLVTACVAIAAFLVGLVVFGWHPFHRLGASSLSAATAAARLAGAAAYISVCMFSVGTIALALGLILPGPAEALGVSVAFVVVSNILDGQPSLRILDDILPTHYWHRWTHLLEGGSSGLPLGISVQLLAAAVALAGGWFVLRRRDPAA